MFDYIVVGAGSAGCVLAARLSEDPEVSVCLLEAGPPDSSVLIHCPAGVALMAKGSKLVTPYETVPQPGLNMRRGYQPRGRVLGGSSSVNAMIYTRGQREDYDGWAAAGNPGWSFDEVLPYFKRAEHNERGADDFHATGGPLNVMDLRSPNRFGPVFVQAAVQAGYTRNDDFNAATQEGVGLYQVTHRNGERCGAASAYLSPNLDRRNLQVLTGVQVLRVLLEGGRARGVELRQGGATRQLTARREVIVAAGALQSPQMLMLSGIGPGEHLQQQGVATLHDLPGVGRHLHDHPDVVLVHDAPQLTELMGISFSGVWRGLKGAVEWRRQRSGMLTTNYAEAGGFIRSSPDETRPDLQLHFVIAKIVDHARKTVLGHGFTCHVCVLRPLSRGRITLAGPDPMAAPLIDPDFLGNDDDFTRLVRGFKAMRRILQQPALAAHGGRELAVSAAAQSDEQIGQFVRNHADTVYHPVGSCRMGPGPDDVVDARLRVHGLHGLRVVDASVMPQIVSGNTNAPTIMIAEKAADMIKADAKAA